MVFLSAMWARKEYLASRPWGGLLQEWKAGRGRLKIAVLPALGGGTIA